MGDRYVWASMFGLPWLVLLNCVTQLALAGVALSQARRTPVGGPLAVLCFVIFGWNFASAASIVQPSVGWSVLDTLVSPWTAPLALHLVAAFVGRTRAGRRELVLGYALAFALGVFAVLSPGNRPQLSGSATWSVLTAALGTACIGLALGWLLAHGKRESEPTERANTILVALALVVGFAGSALDLLDDVWVNLPRLGALGTLAGSALVSIAVFRVRLLAERPQFGLVATAVGIAVLLILGYGAVFEWTAAGSAVWIAGILTVTLLGLAVLVPVLRNEVAARARRERFAVAGRLSSQLAHDLKNPLAAIQGAVQFLEQERALGRSIDSQAIFLSLIGDEARRAARAVDRYGRLARLELERTSEDLRALVSDAVGAAEAHSGHVIMRRELAATAGATSTRIDRELVRIAIDNVLSNAIEAMPDGGEIRVSVAEDARHIRVEVQDTGAGMDARVRDRVFDEFFTTKASGTGLGLPFARRVIEAHGGSLSLESGVGKGTKVCISLPVSPHREGTPRP
jgi:two-component system sensor histidine kinase HydH